MKRLHPLLLCLILASCQSAPKYKTKLIYFGYTDHSESQEDIIGLAKTWDGSGHLCPQWRSTIDEKNGDYRIFFGRTENFTMVGKNGNVIYGGGTGVLMSPNGNPDGTGLNLCKLTED